MDATTIRSISIVGACILGTFLFVKGSEMKEKRQLIEKSESYLTTSIPKVFALNDVEVFSAFMGSLSDTKFYNEMKESLGSCTMVSKPKCEPYTRQGGCPYTRENMRCHIKLNCNKVAYVQVRIDLSRYNNAVNAISLIK